MAFDLCVIPASVVPYLSALQTRKFSITDITAHLVSEKLTREQCRLMTPDTFASSYGSSSHALHVRSSVSSEINLAITSSVSGNAPSGYTIVIQGCLNDHNSQIVLGVCVSDEPIVADASLRMFVNIEETNNVFRLRADFDGMVTQGLLDDILYQSLEAYPTIALYNHSTKKITFKNASNTELPNMEIDASAFIKDGMVNDVVIQNENLVVSFNTDAGKEDISIPLSSIFDPSNYYTKTQTDTQISHAIDALGSGSSKFVVANVNTSYPSQISNLMDHRPDYRQSGTSSDNPHYNSKNASFMFDVSELPSNGTTFEVFFPSTSFVGSVQLVCGSSNYIYPIYFRGNDNVHCPTVPQGSVLRITFYENAFYGDFYDLADFGDEHEAYVYVGKVPVDKSGSDLLAFSGLVGIDRDTGKFSQLFTVNVTENGAGVISPRLKENSPIYACFQGDCFAAHPKVPFGNILRIHEKFYGQGATLSTNMLPFTYYPFDDGDTVDAHVVENPNTNTSSPEKPKYKYFQVDNCPVYIQVESNRVLLGNPPADIPARLIGFMCSGAENAGMIRLVESADVSYMSDDEYSKTFAGVWDDNSVDTSLSYLSDNVLVGLSNSSSKLVPLLVDGACNGDVMINPDLDWDSPVYVLFAGYRCFSAHPLVDFRQVLKSDNGYFMFTFSPMGSVGSETPDFVEGADGKQYFGRANYPVFVSDFCGSNSGYKSFCVGIPSDVNIPSSDLHWRLLGYTTSTPGYIRLTESHPFLKDFIHQTGGYVKLSEFTDTFRDASCGGYVTPSQYVEHFKASYGLQVAVQNLVSNYGESVFHIKDLDASSVSLDASEQNGEVYVRLPSMTTVEFTDRVSFRTSTGEAAYIDSDGVYNGKATRAYSSTYATSATSSTYARYLRYSSTNVLSAESESVVTSNATIRPASSNSSLNLGTSAYKWGSVYATYLGELSYPLTSSYSTSIYCTNVYSSGSSAVQCFTLGTNSSYANDISIPGTNSDGSRGYLHPYVDYGADLGSDNRCFNKVWTKDIKAYGIIYGDLSGNADTATNATSATYATNLRYSSTNVLTATGTSTVTSVATISPKTSGEVSLGTSSSKWNYIYANYGKFSTSLATDGTLTVTGASTLSGGASLSGDIVINESLYFGSGKTVKMRLFDSGIDVTGHLTPVSGSTYNLGSDRYPWQRLYVNYISGSGVAKSIAGYVNGTSQNSPYPVGSLILAQITTATYSSGTQLKDNTLANQYEFGDMPASKIRKVSLYASGNKGNVTCWQNSGEVLSGTWRVVGDVWSSSVTKYPPVVLAVRIA